MADIGLAQYVAGKLGRIDAIDVTLPKDADAAQWVRFLQKQVPAGVTVERVGARTEQNSKMLAAFRWNLRILSYIALVVGAFLIYNTIAVSVVRRRTDIGIMRALGATRFSVLAAFLTEAAAFGIGGGVLGLAPRTPAFDWRCEADRDHSAGLVCDERAGTDPVKFRSSDHRARDWSRDVRGCRVCSFARGGPGRSY